jgi:hypothetical protein
MSEKSKQLGKEYIDSMLDPNGSFTQYGLTKREYFAGIAMQGLLSNETVNSILSGNNGMQVPDLVAEYSLQYADSLLEKLSIEALS